MKSIVSYRRGCGIVRSTTHTHTLIIIIIRCCGDGIEVAVYAPVLVYEGVESQTVPPASGEVTDVNVRVARGLHLTPEQ